MKMKIEWKSAALGAVLAAGTLLTMAAATGSTRKPMEYRVVGGHVWNSELQDLLNKFGSNHWELVSTSGAGDRYGYAVLQRPRE